MVRITCGNPFSHAHNSTSNHLSPLRRVQGHPEKTGGGRVWAHQFSVLPANQARRTTCVHYQPGAGNAKKKYAGCSLRTCRLQFSLQAPSTFLKHRVLCIWFRYKLYTLLCHSKCSPFPYAKRHCWLFFGEVISEMRRGLVYIWSN